MTSLPLLVGVREASRELGLGRDLVYGLVHTGQIRSVRVAGRRILIPRTELEAFVARELEGEGVIATNDAGNTAPPGLGGRVRH